MDKQKVFISYKSEEFEEAKWVKDFLESHGIMCWMAPMSITGGASYASEIPQAIRNSQVVVLILSEKCQTSKWVPREIDQAINDEKVVMPFMVEDCELRDEFQFYLTNVQRYPAYENRDEAAAKMLREIKDIIGFEEEEEVTEEPVKVQPVKTVKPVDTKTKKQKKKSQKGSKKPLLFAGGVACIILLSIILSVTSKVTIAGEKVKKSSYNIEFAEKTITQEDAEKIAKLKDLGRVKFTDCTFELEDMSLLCKEKMNEMHFINCSLDDKKLSTFAFDKLADLTILNLYGNPIRNTEGIEKLSALRELNISYTEVKGINFVNGLSQLETLCADGLGITNVGVLNNFSSLKVLSLNENKLESLKGLEHCIELEYVFASNNRLTSLEGLENTTRLYTIFLNGNQLDEDDFFILAKSSQTLKEVFIDDNEAKNMAFLQDCVQIEKLSADNNQIEDAGVVSNFSALKKLSLEGNTLTQFPDLKACTQLKFLDMSHNQIQEVELLSAGESLKYGIVDLSYNRIEKITLSGTMRLDLLDLYQNHIHTFMGVENLSVSNFVMDFHEMHFEETWRNLTLNNVIISNCPLDRQMELDTQFEKRAILCERVIEEDEDANQRYTEIKEKVRMGIGDVSQYIGSAVMF